ncbi:MAG: hypothetical protein ACYC6O_03425 [Thermoleophilia bacterium]
MKTAKALVLTALLFTGFGCGGSADNGSPGEEQLSLEAGADVSVSDQNTDTTGSSAVDGTDVFTAADLPVEAGRELVFSANTPGTSTQVIFDIEGPWSFMNGARQSTLTVSTQPAESGFSAKSFPEAQIVTRSSWSPSPNLVEYNFQRRDDHSWTAYGRSDEDGRIVTYTNPSEAMIFPISVGDSWVDRYTEVVDGHSTDVIAENKIVARNQLTVPAGSFDAFLLQTRVTAKPRGRQTTTVWDYTWFVPGIGRAAEIISLPDEKLETFDTASAFYRLESYR